LLFLFFSPPLQFAQTLATCCDLVFLSFFFVWVTLPFFFSQFIHLFVRTSFPPSSLPSICGGLFLFSLFSSSFFFVSLSSPFLSNKMFLTRGYSFFHLSSFSLHPIICIPSRHSIKTVFFFCFFPWFLLLVPAHSPPIFLSPLSFPSLFRFLLTPMAPFLSLSSFVLIIFLSPSF